jgi:hypothetical protein
MHEESRASGGSGAAIIQNSRSKVQEFKSSRSDPEDPNPRRQASLKEVSGLSCATVDEKHKLLYWPNLTLNF